MRGDKEAARVRRAHEFEAFAGGAAGRLLHVATLLTCDDAKAADRLLCHALARTYLRWDRLRGEDPYAYARQELVTSYARRAGVGWLHPRRREETGRLAGLTPQERVIVVLRLFEGVEDEQVAALLGIAPDRVTALCTRACVLLRGGAQSPAASFAGRAAPASGR